MTIKTPSVSLPRLPKVRLHTVVIVLCSVGLLGILAFGVVRAQQQAEAQAASQRALQETAAKAEAQRKAVLAAKDLEISRLASDKQAICSYLSGLTTAKATRSLVTLPTAAHCNK